MDEVLLFTVSLTTGVIIGYWLKKIEILIIVRKTVARYGKKNKQK